MTIDKARLDHCQDCQMWWLSQILEKCPCADTCVPGATCKVGWHRTDTTEANPHLKKVTNG